MQSLAGNKYVPRLGQIGCESDGRSVIKFHNFRIDFLFRLLRALEGKDSNWASYAKFLLIYFFAAISFRSRGCTY